ncbi:SMP-30/gluconolactonase/LRE family protein [Glaciimonas sp. GG7]
MTKQPSIEILDVGLCAVGESPIWCARHALWYWVDIAARKIWQFNRASGAARYWLCDEMVACIALTEQGNLIAGMESGLFAVRLPALEDRAEARPLASPPELVSGQRFNDGRCDRQGRFWSGTMALNMASALAHGHLYRYDFVHGLSIPIVSDLFVQNGLAWSPDGRTMYLSDSHPSRRVVWAFDYDIDSGTPSAQRVFIDMAQHCGRPDGAAIDVDGGYWTCANDAGRLLRFTAKGELDQSIALPFTKPSMCSFGGAHMESLLVTSISAGAPVGDTMAGTVVMLNPGVTSIRACPWYSA